jgi:hypothetical protein
MECDHFLNAPDYLFVSTNVAKKFPQLMESILVQAYSNHMPGELAKTWQVGSVARIQRHQRLHRTTLLAAVLGVMQYLGTAPFIFHRMFIRFVQPFVFSAIVLLWRLIVADTNSIIISCAVLVAAIGYALYRRYAERAVVKSRRVMAEYRDSQHNFADLNADIAADALHTPKVGFPDEILRFSADENDSAVEGTRSRRYSSFHDPDGSADSGEEEKETASEQDVGLRARTYTENSTDAAEHRSSLLSVLGRARVYSADGEAVRVLRKRFMSGDSETLSVGVRRRFASGDSDSISVSVRKRFMSGDSEAFSFPVSDSEASSLPVSDSSGSSSSESAE